MKSVVIAFILASSASCMAIAKTEIQNSEDPFDPAVEISRAKFIIKNDIIKGDASFKSIFITKISSSNTEKHDKTESEIVDIKDKTQASDELEPVSIKDMYHVCGKVKEGGLLSKSPYKRFVYFSQDERKLVSVDGDGQFTTTEFEKIWKGGCKIKKVKDGFQSETVYEEKNDFLDDDDDHQ